MSGVGIIRELPDLPDEMWAMVFTYLPLAERESIRLSCQRFYKICNCVRFQKNEQIVLHGKRYSRAAIRSLSRSQRRTWNIKLTGAHCGDTCILEFLKLQGSNVYSLTLDSCKLAPGIFGYIIEHCDNLREIMLIFDSVIDISFYTILFDDLRILRTMGVIRDKVINISLEIPYKISWLSTFYHSHDDFPCLFHIFPCINDKINLTIHVQEKTNYPVSQQIEKFSFSGSYNEVKENLMVKDRFLQKPKTITKQCQIMRNLSAQCRLYEQMHRQCQAFQREKKKPRLL